MGRKRIVKLRNELTSAGWQELEHFRISKQNYFRRIIGDLHLMASWVSTNQGPKARDPFGSSSRVHYVDEGHSPQVAGGAFFDYYSNYHMPDWRALGSQSKKK